jgi:branched-chain amino acid transport system ATP-binding protein
LALLTLDHVRRRFGGIVAVDDVSFDVDTGQVVGLIGPNGAGKTTLFNLITRVYKADGGSILFAGENLLRIRAHAIVRSGIARTFQNVDLFRSMTAVENVLVALPSGDERRARSLLEFVGAGDVAQCLVTGLPFPTQKKVELARALAAEPKLVLLDEPASGLSHEEIEKLADLIRALRDELGLTVLLVEHHMNLVMRVSQTVHVLDFGRLIASGTPDEVRANPAVIEAYLGPADDAAA